MKFQNQSPGELALMLGITLLLAFAAFNLNESASNINGITGDVISRVNVSPMREVPCNFSLQNGLNLVSFFCITYETPRQSVISNITGLFAIFEYQENSADRWRAYNPSLPAGVIQDLQVMSRTKGYWIIENRTEDVFVYGAVRVPTNINLRSGWNLAGYPTNNTKFTNVSFWSLGNNFTEVRGFDPVNKVFLSFIPPDSGGLRETNPYNGYWINMSMNGVWIVD
jgi:hypothetical protein